MTNLLFPKSFFALVTLLVSAQAFSQVSLQWEKFYGDSYKQNDQARAMVGDDKGNVYVAGVCAGVNNKPDYVTIKYDASGTEKWVARYDGVGGVDEAYAMTIDKSGNIYVTGNSDNGTGTWDFATVKYNNDGVQQWAARFNGPGKDLDYAAAIKVDKDGNVYVSGLASVTGYSSDCAVVKYNSSGEMQWVRYYDGSGHGSDVAFAMAIDPVTSDVYVTGNSTSIGNNIDYVTIRYNSAGVEQWVRTYNGTGNFYDDARVIALDSQGNVYVSGSSRAPGNVYDCATIKYDSSGTLQWVERYSGPANNICQPTAMIADKMGNIYITGFTVNSQNNYLCSTLKYNSEGILQWTQLYSGLPGGNNIGWSIAMDNQDNIYVAAESSGGSTSLDFITLKYNSGGVQQWVERYDVSNLINIPCAIVVNKFNDVFVAGSVRTYADITADYYNIATIKYAQTKPLVVTTTPDTTVFYGYGSNCVQLKAETSGGVAPYRFSWSPGGTVTNEQSVSVCPTATTVYTVTVTDANGTTATAAVTAKVIDIRCGNQLRKVLVCHKGQELCIASTAVAEHLQHGDRLGRCSENNNQISNYETGKATAAPGVMQKEIIGASIKSYPNPLKNTSTISYVIPSEAYVSIKLFRLTGEEIKTIVQEKKIAGNYNVSLDAGNLVPGVYFCRMTVGSKNSQFTRMLKITVIK